MEQLMVYFVFTYFCGAVYDEQAYRKLKFAVAGCILIRALAKGVFLKMERWSFRMLQRRHAGMQEKWSIRISTSAKWSRCCRMKANLDWKNYL